MVVYSAGSLKSSLLLYCFRLGFAVLKFSYKLFECGLSFRWGSSLRMSIYILPSADFVNFTMRFDMCLKWLFSPVDFR